MRLLVNIRKRERKKNEENDNSEKSKLIVARNKKAVIFAPSNNGAIAQLVEQRTENPCVPGSIPGGTTTKNLKVRELLKQFSFFMPISEMVLGWFSWAHVNLVGILRYDIFNR